MTDKKKKRSLTATIRNYFFTGVVVLIPIGFTLYLTKFLISISSKLIPSEINPNSYLNFSIPGLEIILSIFLITLIGGLSLSFIGKKFLQFIQNIKLSEFNFVEFKTVYFFPSNRWDIVTIDNVLIKLPEKNLLKSLNRAHKIIASTQFKDQNTIDLRIKNHLIIK